MKTILIIDDEQGIIEFMQMALEAHHYKVLSALNGEDGMATALSELPDIILLDIMMPGINGLEVCKKLKANETTLHIPILMISAKAQTSDVEIGMSSGAEDYIVKPFEMKDLLEKIKKYLT